MCPSRDPRSLCFRAMTTQPPSPSSLSSSALKLHPDIERHPVSESWPDHDTETAQSLSASIRTHGPLPQYPIVLADGPDGQTMVLDGWHRLQEFRRQNIADELIPVETYSGDDPAGYVAAIHLSVRRLSIAELAEAVVRSHDVAGTLRRRGRHGSPNAVTNAEIAKKLAISESSVAQARRRVAADKSGPADELPADPGADKPKASSPSGSPEAEAARPSGDAGAGAPRSAGRAGPSRRPDLPPGLRPRVSAPGARARHSAHRPRGDGGRHRHDRGEARPGKA